ncbi:MAG: hypothetical protein CMJ80_00435 [Planctomycetaceae bacterium]|nr:hypothetical protein [Planctomycetaceae bacterium]
MQKKSQSELEAQANVFFQSNYLEDATEICNSIIAQSSSSFVAYRILGQVALRLEEYEGAVHLFMRSLEIYPHQASTLSDLGIALFRIGFFEDAATSFEKSIEIDSVNLTAYQYLYLIRNSRDQVIWNLLIKNFRN